MPETGAPLAVAAPLVWNLPQRCSLPPRPLLPPSLHLPCVPSQMSPSLGLACPRQVPSCACWAPPLGPGRPQNRGGCSRPSIVVTLVIAARSTLRNSHPLSSQLQRCRLGRAARLGRPHCHWWLGHMSFGSLRSCWFPHRCCAIAFVAMVHGGQLCSTGKQGGSGS